MPCEKIQLQITIEIWYRNFTKAHIVSLFLPNNLENTFNKFEKGKVSLLVGQ